MRAVALLGLAAAATGVTLLVYPGDRVDRRERGIIVVPGGNPPPGAAMPRQDPLVPTVSHGATGADRATAGAAPPPLDPDDAPQGDPGIWAIPAEFAPPE